MSKKYVPSGYQIISIDCSDKTSGTGFVPVTEDEKLLHQLLSGMGSQNIVIKKPILLDVIDTNTNHWIGIPSIFNGILTLNYGELGGSSQLVISADPDELTVTYTEE